MTKTFSTKLDAKVLQMLDQFCHRYHLKKSSLLEEIIAEGLQRRAQALELALSIERGLEQEKEGHFYSAEEVEKSMLKKK